MTSGVAWIREQDYRWARKRMIDGYLFPPAYKNWTATVEAEIRRCMAAGHIVEKIIIEPNQFEGWCRQRGLRMHSYARMLFADEAAQHLRNVRAL
jgi:hypothetical protein